jgi:hypothetical protein
MSRQILDAGQKWMFAQNTSWTFHSLGKAGKATMRPAPLR